MQIVISRLNWRWLLAFTSVPSFMVLILHNLALESPRYLYMNGQRGKAQAVLEKIALLNKSELPNGMLILAITSGVVGEELEHPYNTSLLSLGHFETPKQKSDFFSLSTLFSSRLIRTTFLLWWLFFANSFIYYGIILLTSKVTSLQSECKSIEIITETLHNSNVYLSVFLASLGVMIQPISPSHLHI